MAKNYPPDVKEFVEQRAYELRVKQGLTFRQIAAVIKSELEVDEAEKLSAETVRLAVKRMRAAASSEIDALKLQVLSDLYEQGVYLFGEAMTAWEKSKEPTTEVTQVFTTNPPPYRDPSRRGPKPKGLEPSVSEEVTTKVVERLPDPRYLQVGIEVMKLVRDLFGINQSGQPSEVSKVQIEVIRKKLTDVRDDAR